MRDERGGRQGLCMAARAFVLAVTVAACGGTPTPGATEPPLSPGPNSTPAPTSASSTAPSQAPVAVEGPLGEALRFVGPGLATLSWTDWRSIKTSIGALELTSADSFESKVAALAPAIGGRMPPTEAPIGGFGIRFLRSHIDLWGFDVTDLDWEIQVEVTRGGPPLWVLRFRDGFDFGPLEAKLDAYGFSRESLPHGTLRSVDFMGLTTVGAVGQKIQLFGTTEPGIGNTGFLDDGRTLVLSWGPSPAPDDGATAVRDILTNGGPDAATASVRSAAARLEGPASALVRSGSDQCRSYARTPGPAGDVQAAVDAVLAEAGVLRPYEVMAIGYSRTHDPIGRIEFEYADAAAAAADLDGRRLLAVDGVSSVSRSSIVTYQRVFTVVDARAVDRTLVMDVAPHDDIPRLLFTIAIQRDLLFGACTD